MRPDFSWIGKLKHAVVPLFYVIFVKTKIRNHLVQKTRSDFFFAIFENCFIPAVIQGAMTAFAAFRLKADSDIILLSKFLQFLENSLPFMYGL